MRSILEIRHKIGINCLTTSLRDIMESNGYEADEDFCMGLSGAFSFWYSKSNKFMQATGLGNNVFTEFAAITKVQHNLLKIEDNDKAWYIACEYIKNKIPVLLEVELAAYAEYLSNSPKSEKAAGDIRKSIDFKIGGHVTCMVGYDKQNVWLHENMIYKPVSVPIELFKEARNPSNIEYIPPENKLHTFHFPERLPEMDYLLDMAVIRVINNMELAYKKPVYCGGGITYEGSGFYGIKLLFDDIKNIYITKDAQGIMQLKVLELILNRWGGNEVNRASYGRFLRQLARRTDNRKYEEAANIYYTASGLWRGFLKELHDQPVNTTFDYNFILFYEKEILEKEKAAIGYLHEAVKY